MSLAWLVFAGLACEGPSGAPTGGITARDAAPDQCDPLATECPPGSACGRAQGHFMCLPGGNGQFLDPCAGEDDIQCEDGFMCITNADPFDPDGKALTECEHEFCCTMYCDDGFPCPEHYDCAPIYEPPAPPGKENFGYCVGGPKIDPEPGLD